METLTRIMLAVAVVLVAAAAILLMGRRTRNGGGRERPTEFLDESGTCEICFGDLDGKVVACGCGKRFHDSCAEPTGTCPYCNAPYTDFVELRDGTRCPNCGRYPRGNVCRCGAVLSAAGGFRCPCGSDIDRDTLVCGGCGKTYEMCE